MQETSLDSIKHTTLKINKRKELEIDGVISVVAFSPSQITLSLSDTKLIIVGNDLKITEFSRASGKFSAVGNIISVKYSASLAKLKIFK